MRIQQCELVRESLSLTYLNIPTNTYMFLYSIITYIGIALEKDLFMAGVDKRNKYSTLKLHQCKQEHFK